VLFFRSETCSPEICFGDSGQVGKMKQRFSHRVQDEMANHLSSSCRIATGELWRQPTQTKKRICPVRRAAQEGRLSYRLHSRSNIAKKLLDKH